MSRSMLPQAGLSAGYWQFSVPTVTYILQRSVNRGALHDLTPFEVFFGLRPAVCHVRVFGCVGYITAEYKKTDLSRAVKARFLGYDSRHKKMTFCWVPVSLNWLRLKILERLFWRG